MTSKLLEAKRKREGAKTRGKAFKRIFSGYLDILSSDEETLSPYLRDQLERLRSPIS